VGVRLPRYFDFVRSEAGSKSRSRLAPLSPAVPAATSPKPFAGDEARRLGLCVRQTDAAGRWSEFDFFRFIAVLFAAIIEAPRWRR
jgi:hypothetical protein